MDVPKRGVTGHDTEGNAVFVADEQVAPVTLALLPESEYHRLWGSDVTCQFPDDGAQPEARSYSRRWVASGRILSRSARRRHGTPADLDIEAALAEFERSCPVWPSISRRPSRARTQRPPSTSVWCWRGRPRLSSRRRHGR